MLKVRNQFRRGLEKVMLSLVLFTCSTVAMAQNKVSGVIRDAQGEPLIGVSVIEAGTQNGTITDVDGRYSLDVKRGAKLNVSYIGFEPQTINAGESITLREDNQLLNEVVVVGYGTMRRKDVTSSITTVQAKDLNQGVFTDPAQMLQGKVPGLVVSSTADPNGSPTITLRGASTLRTGAMSPYYVVDGIPGVDISIVSPDDIESIDVLRDATATAIYGSKAANGVIMVTTKKGTEERTNVAYNGYVAFDHILKTYDMASASDLRRYAQNNPGITLKDGGADVDWQDQVLRTGISHSHNVNISGGNATTNYMISGNVIKREGVVKMTGMDRFNLRSLVSTKVLKDHLTLSMGFNSMYGKHFGVPTGNEGASVLDAMNYYSPTNAIRNTDGSWTVGTGSKNYNPLAMMEENRSETIWKRNQFIAKTALELWKGFFWNVNYSWSNYQSTYSGYNTRKSQFEGIGNKNGQTSRNTYFGREQTFETYLNYGFKVGKSKWDLMAGYSWEEKKNNDGFGATVEGYYNDDLSWFYMAGANNILNINSVQSGSLDRIRNISFYGRANYSFDSRYMLQATVRRDGSSVFGKNKRWGTFPSVSLAWNITEEGFMKNQNVFDNLKLRAGYGISGNAMGFDPYSSYPAYGAVGLFEYDNKWYRIYGATKNPNLDLKWESTGMLNIGLDFAFLKGRINGTIEVYHKKTKDLIWSYPVPTTKYIYSWLDVNIGEMTNKGIEFTLNMVPVKTRTFTWNTTINLSHNKNVVDKMQNEQFQTTLLTQGDPMVAGVSANGWTQRIMEGESIGTFYTYQYAGTVNGRSEYYVLDENGKRTAYKNWNLNAFITGVFGNDVYNGPRAHYNSAQMFSDGKNVMKEFLGFPIGDATGVLPSDRWIEKGTYIRLQSLSLSYTFRNCFNDWIQDLTLYGTANNLLTITNYKGLDPEVNMGGLDPGVDYRWSRYPHTRSLMVGVKINFGGGKKKKATPVYVDREVIKEVPVVKEVIKEVVKEVPGKDKDNFVQSTYVVTFPVNSSEIMNAAELSGIEKGATVEIVAYASPEGNTDVNQKLSQERADAVAKYLKDKGVNVIRITAKGADTNHANRIAIVTVK